jgi:hypothetical protein
MPNPACAILKEIYVIPPTLGSRNTSQAFDSCQSICGATEFQRVLCQKGPKTARCKAQMRRLA